MRPALIFVSYRRRDTGPFALALRSELELRLDGAPIFLDLSRIQGGDFWEEVLEDALTKATILIALIGPDWIGEQDGQPSRIEAKNDWVRKEVARALRHPSDALLPVLVNHADLPRKDRLPKDLQRLCDIQAIPLRTESWDSDVAQLCQVLESRFLVRVKKLDELLPKPDALKQYEEPLSDKSLDETKRLGMLPGWEIEITHDVAKTGYVRESLRKLFKCESDAQAFSFVSKLLPLVKDMKHHPRVEMIFKSVTIRLSTIDAGYRVTSFDRRMAVGIDEIFNELRHSPSG